MSEEGSGVSLAPIVVVVVFLALAAPKLEIERGCGVRRAVGIAIRRGVAISGSVAISRGVIRRGLIGDAASGA
jgi:hypothetical protein